MTYLGQHSQTEHKRNPGNEGHRGYALVGGGRLAQCAIAKLERAIFKESGLRLNAYPRYSDEICNTNPSFISYKLHRIRTDLGAGTMVGCIPPFILMILGGIIGALIGGFNGEILGASIGLVIGVLIGAILVWLFMNARYR